MPANKNDKNKTRPPGLEESASPSITASGQGYDARKLTPALPEKPPARKVPASEMPRSDRDEADEDLILTYLTFYRLLERALVRGGFVMAASVNKQARPDWYGWARHIEKKFDPDSAEEVRGAVAYLLGLQDDEEPRPVRTQNRLQWQTGCPFSDNLWLADMLQQTTMQLTYRYNFAETPGCDTPQVMAALFVAEEWLQLVRGE